MRNISLEVQNLSSSETDVPSRKGWPLDKEKLEETLKVIIKKNEKTVKSPWLFSVTTFRLIFMYAKNLMPIWSRHIQTSSQCLLFKLCFFFLLWICSLLNRHQSHSKSVSMSVSVCLCLSLPPHTSLSKIFFNQTICFNILPPSEILFYKRRHCS